MMSEMLRESMRGLVALNVLLAAFFFATGYGMAYFTAPRERVVERQPIYYNNTIIENRTVYINDTQIIYVNRTIIHNSTIYVYSAYYNLTENATYFEISLFWTQLYTGQNYTKDRLIYMIYTNVLNLSLVVHVYDNPISKLLIRAGWNLTGEYAFFSLSSKNYTSGAYQFWLVDDYHIMENREGVLGLGEGHIYIYDYSKNISAEYHRTSYDYTWRWAVIDFQIKATG